MATFLLTWNPEGSGWPQEDHERAVEAHAAGTSLVDRWSVGIRRSGIAAGDRALLVRQRHERGIVASGFFTSDIYTGKHWDDPSRQTTYANVQWDVLLPVEDRLEIDELKRSVPLVAWDRLQGSGVLAPPPSDRLLETLWHRHTAATPYRLPGEHPPATYEEGGVTRVEVNVYERDRSARAACIAHHGLTCVVCGFNFEQYYGDLGRDFIHVHHLKEISTLWPGYRIDPIKDLRPLCANCHSIVHRARPALQPDELRRRIGARTPEKPQGEVVRPREGADG